MSIDLVKKRDGSIAEFNTEKIEKAIGKAYSAAEKKDFGQKVSSLTNDIVITLELKFKDTVPTVEEIQDIVEKEIAEIGDFDVARAYIVYRKEHQTQREERREALLEKIDNSEIIVKKRNGELAVFDITQVRKAIQNYCGEYEGIDINEVVQACKLNIFDGITTSEINKAIVMVLKARIERDHAYSFATARFLINDLYKEVLGVDEFSPDFQKIHKETFKKNISHGVEDGRYDTRLLNFNFDLLTEAFDTSRDRLFSFMGTQILHDRYFLRDSAQKIIETPQYFWMRVAMGLSLDEKNPTAAAIEFYNTISRMLYVSSTPTLLHSGTSHSQMSSCYLSTVEDDLNHIFKVIGDNAQLAKWSGGIGNDWTNIRATNAAIKSTNVGSQGLIPFLKIVDSTTASINRSGKRRGATCVYLETWHADILDFLDLRKNTGDDRRRTHDINTSNWIPDLFMKRVIEDGEWTLFSPEEVPELHHIYGKEFEDTYIAYEKKAAEGKIALHTTIKATKLWRKMITMLFETGHAWITFKDPCNVRSPQDHVGVVHGSNLCTEITLNTSAEETAVCNLGSINLPRHIIDGKLDKKLMASTVRLAMRMLDNVIDLNFYPTVEAKTSNLRHRPVGIGIMGYQDLLYSMNMAFDTDEAVKLSDQIMEFISYHAILGSSEIAKEKGTYSSYKGSKWDRGIFPVDTVALLEKERGMSTEINTFGVLDWSDVRDHVAQHGMRNSNCLAIAPTATIANISGCLPSIEPIYKNLYVKSNFSGEFTVINQALVEELKTHDLWNNDMLEKLKHSDGSIQNITEIPDWIKPKYKEVFEIDAQWIVKHAAHRGKWMDQSQSVNIFTSSESGKFISDIYINAWKSGLKTTYYLRSLGATSVEKSTLDINKKFDTAPNADKNVTQPVTQKGKIHVFKEDICESCQ
ncbi:ribonucleoside-diphosphate reductase subunit alpha [Candidatus Wolfebacteria bacterium]|nr:MAG: ribonucleoside-diphosphate reductase subunit alpha [Candidatus Wolfebacteria bacterium]